MDQVIFWGGVAAVCVVFWLARRIATRLDWTQRKLTLYVLVTWPFVPLILDNKGIGAGIAVIGFMMAIPLFFAVLTAPDKP